MSGGDKKPQVCPTLYSNGMLSPQLDGARCELPVGHEGPHRFDCSMESNGSIFCVKCSPRKEFNTVTELVARTMAVHNPRHSYNAEMKASLRGYTSAERKAMPLHTGCMMYFPDALMAVARVSKAGNDKHNPGEPLHWARGKSMDQTDCEARHLLTPDAIDSDSGETERAHKAWRALADLQIAEEKRLVAAGIRPLSGIIPDDVT